MSAPKHIFWDWNGTLLDDVWLCHAVCNAMLERRGLTPMSLDHYRSTFDFPVIDYYRRVGFDLERESFDALSVEFITAYEAQRHECALHAETVRVLEQLRVTQTLSILSAYKQDTLEAVIAEHNLKPFFKRIQGHTDIYAAGKEAGAKSLVAALGVDSAEVLMVGDTVHDAHIARVLGASCVLVAHGHQNRERLLATGYPVIDSLPELLRWVD